MTNIFERAVFAKLRFATTMGNLNTEDICGLSLTNLNTLAKALNKELKAEADEDFLEVKTAKMKEKADMLQLRFDIVLSVLNKKKLAKEKAALRKEISEKKAVITDLIVSKRNEALAGKSIEELEEELNKLDE